MRNEYFKLRGKTVYELAPGARKQALDNERKNQFKDAALMGELHG